MKKYLFAAATFIFNNEVISWIAVVAIAVMVGVDFLVAVIKEKDKRDYENSLPVEYGEVWK